MDGVKQSKKTLALPELTPDQKRHLRKIAKRKPVNLKAFVGKRRAPNWTWVSPWRAVVVNINLNVLKPHHGPQYWTAWPPVVVSFVRTETILREDRERQTHFSYNIWLYTARGAWVWNIAFKKGLRRFGVEPRYANDGVGGMEVGDYIDLISHGLKAAQRTEVDGD